MCYFNSPPLNSNIITTSSTITTYFTSNQPLSMNQCGS